MKNCHQLRNFNKVITKEKYIELKKQGLSDRKILEALGLSYSTYVYYLTKAKKEWNIPGVAVSQSTATGTISLNQPENQVDPGTINADPPENQPENEPVPEPATGAPADDDDEIFFITPCGQVKDPVLQVCAKGVMFNASATKMFINAGVEHVRVGVTKAGVIVLVPSAPSKETYKIGNQRGKGDSTKIGGGALSKGLKQKGIGPGKCHLEYNEAKARFEARTEVS